MEVVALRSRVIALETMVMELSAKVDKLTHENFLQTPPGLQTLVARPCEALEQRLDTLEKVFLLVDWLDIEKSAKLICGDSAHLRIREALPVTVFDMTLGDKGDNGKSSETDQRDMDTELESSDGDQHKEEESLITEMGQHNSKENHQVSVEQQSGEESWITETEQQSGEENEDFGFEASSGCSAAEKHWRCFHCWTNLESEKAICRYCKDKTVAKMFEPT